MLTVGYDPDFAPITSTNNIAEADGRAIRLLREACGKAGVDCRFEPVALPQHEACLAAGSIDALAVMAMTPERRERFTLSDPYLMTGAAWFAPKSPKSDESIPFDPAGVEQGTRVVTPSAGPLTNVVATRWPHLTVMPATDYRDALEQVAADRVFAAALNIDAGTAMCEELYPGTFALPQTPFLEIPLALACLKGRSNREFERLATALDRVNAGLST
jgi:hypothetical protein